MSENSILLSIDPGRDKCGYARVNGNGDPLSLEILTGSQILQRIDSTLEEGIPDIVIGNGTYSRDLVRNITEMVRTRAESREILRLWLIDERNSTLEARELFFLYNPPRGLRRLLPRGLLAPDQPVDHYAALVLARRFLEKGGEKVQLS